MNIFTVLSQGKGRLNEENLSAMLGFLLTPQQTHGLGDVFLHQFLRAVAQSCKDPHRFDNVLYGTAPTRTEVLLESAYMLGAQRRVVDIEVQISIRQFNPMTQEMEYVELHRIAIENKVKAQAADREQLREEFLGILQELESDDQVQITMVFLTPPGDAPRLTEEFTALDETLLGKHKKAWLRWAGADDEPDHITALIKNLLRQEDQAAISPISEYLRHTLKAFVRHILDSPAGSTQKGVALGIAPELGDIIQVVTVDLGGVTYQLERYESSTVRVLNTATQEYEVVKPILRQINREKDLKVPPTRPGGGSKNTRTLGREIMRALIEQAKAEQVSTQ